MTTNVMTKSDHHGVKAKIQIMMDSINHNHNAQDVRFRKRKSDNCTNCGAKETIFHLVNCSQHKDDLSVGPTRERLKALVLSHIADETKLKYTTNDRTKLTVQLHPLDYIQEEVTSIQKGRISQAQREFFTQIVYRNNFHREFNNENAQTDAERADPPRQAETRGHPEHSPRNL